MAHYDNVKDRIKKIINLTPEAYSYFDNTLIMIAQSKIIGAISSNDTLLSEYNSLIQGSVPTNTEYTNLSSDEKKLFHYELATAYFTIKELYTSLKKVSKNTVFLDNISIGEGDLKPVDYETIIEAGELAEQNGYEHLSQATSNYVSGNGFEWITI